MTTCENGSRIVAMRARPKTVYPMRTSDTEVSAPPEGGLSPSTAANDPSGAWVGVDGMLAHWPIVTTSARLASPRAGIVNG